MEVYFTEFPSVDSGFREISSLRDFFSCEKRGIISFLNQLLFNPLVRQSENITLVIFSVAMSPSLQGTPFQNHLISILNNVF